MRKRMAIMQAEIDRLLVELQAAIKERDDVAELLSQALLNLDLWRRKYPSNNSR
jgi:hypothetical protein